MKVLIIEDEYHAQRYLANLLKRIYPQANILAILDSVEDSIEWFEQNTLPDLIFMDIQLAEVEAIVSRERVKVFKNWLDK